MMSLLTSSWLKPSTFDLSPFTHCQPLKHTFSYYGKEEVKLWS